MSSRILLPAAIVALVATALLPSTTARTVDVEPVSPAAIALPTPIRHIVIQIDENNSFERILGDPCRTATRTQPCNIDPATGKPYDVTQPIHTFDRKSVAHTIIPVAGGDIPPLVDHGAAGQLLTFKDQWASIAGCDPNTTGNCFDYLPSTNLQAEVALLQQGTVADNYHTANPTPSWNGHSDFATAGQLDGFTGALPTHTHGGAGARWACNGTDDVAWTDPATGVTSWQPSCFPSTLPGIPGFNGAYRPSKVTADIPTLFEDLDTAGVSWRIYGTGQTPTAGSYQFGICPSFASCVYTSQAANMVPDSQYFTDAAAGTLPEVSFFLPGPSTAGNYSQHNLDSIRVGENMTAQVYNALISGPAASSSVLVKTWDDCGCFWTDELNRQVGQPRINGRLVGPRIGALFAGAYVRQGGTDSTPSDVTSIDAMVEWLFAAGPISPSTPDATAYDFAGVFDFGIALRRSVPIAVLPVTAATRAALQSRPDDPEDPT